MSQELENYVEKEEKEGYKPEQLKKAMLKQGYTEEQAEEALTGIKKRNPWLVLLFSVITLGIYSVFWIVFTTNELREKTKNAPNPWLLLLMIIPGVNIIVSLIYFWKYSKAIEELNGFSSIGLFVLWVFIGIVAMVLSQMELNKVSA